MPFQTLKYKKIPARDKVGSHVIAAVGQIHQSKGQIKILPKTPLPDVFPVTAAK
jgi:hypothetical protein